MQTYSERWGLSFKQNLFISAAIHILLLALVPGLSPGNPLPNHIIEVDVLSLPPKKPVNEKLSLAGGEPKINGGGGGKTEAKLHKKGDEWQWKSLPTGIISTPSGDTKGKEPVPMFVPMEDLPVKGQWIDKQDTISKVSESPSLPAGEIGASMAKATPSVLEGAISPADVSQGIGASGPASGKGGPPTSGLIFDWTGKPRRTLYEPAKPRYSSAVEGTVEAKIWVDADGHVANAMVVKKLDAVLEQLALNYIKQCRFEPLKVKNDKLQTGVAKFYFKLE